MHGPAGADPGAPFVPGTGGEGRLPPRPGRTAPGSSGGTTWSSSPGSSPIFPTRARSWSATMGSTPTPAGAKSGKPTVPRPPGPGRGESAAAAFQGLGGDGPEGLRGGSEDLSTVRGEDEGRGLPDRARRCRPNHPSPGVDGRRREAAASHVFEPVALAAAKLGLKDRGSIKKGNFADLVIFDPLTIADKATYTPAGAVLGRNRLRHRQRDSGHRPRQPHRSLALKNPLWSREKVTRRTTRCAYSSIPY